MKAIHIAVLAAGAALLFSSAAGARPEHPPCAGPPPEAVAACDGRKADDACSFETPRGDDIEGTCKVVGAEEVLACAPADAPARPPKNKKKDD